jgi:predicted TIM-barrel fold metal-dependent hydrolase
MIDAHVHVWTLNPRKYPWRPTLAHVPVPDQPAEAEFLLEEMDAASITNAVLVQPSVYGWDNSYLCDCLERWPSRFVGVCLVNPLAPNAADQLLYWVKERSCRGVRINFIGEHDVEWALGADKEPLWVQAQELGVSVSLQMLPRHAPVVRRLASSHPYLTFIVDYLGPEAFRDSFGMEALDQLASHENVWYKIIVLGPDSKRPFPFEDLWPLYEHAYRRFGAARLVFGSDYPHIYKTCSYVEGMGWLERLPFLDRTARRLISNDNPRALWCIGRVTGGESL